MNQRDEQTVLDAVVIGSGPAGLMAAEMLADAGHSVLVVDAKSSVGRKFLMAGKSGLNITKDESQSDFHAAYGADADWIERYLLEFGKEAVIAWAQEMGQEVFTGSSGRVFPKAMKTSPLLRAWLQRLTSKGVQFQMRWRWTGWDGEALTFTTEQGETSLTPRATVLALGGASWSRLGSDGKWASLLQAEGVGIEPFKPANVGFVVEWSSYMQPHFGAAIKPLRLTAGDTSVLGELTISEHGIEGGGVYAVSRAVRDGAPLVLDLAPDLTAATLSARMAKLGKKASRNSLLRKVFRFGPAKSALINEFARGASGESLVQVAKALTIEHAGPRPIDEAISTAGGVAKDAVDQSLMLLAKPGVFCAGEMLDWEAPTGGYLITACLATGRAAGLGAAAYLSQ